MSSDTSRLQIEASPDKDTRPIFNFLIKPSFTFKVQFDHYSTMGRNMKKIAFALAVAVASASTPSQAASFLKFEFVSGGVSPSDYSSPVWFAPKVTHQASFVAFAPTDSSLGYYPWFGVNGSANSGNTVQSCSVGGLTCDTLLISRDYSTVRVMSNYLNPGSFIGGDNIAFHGGPGTYIGEYGSKLTVSLVDSVNAVPEPATWAMMIGGFGMVGGAMRSARRKRKVSVSYA